MFHSHHRGERLLCVCMCVCLRDWAQKQSSKRQEYIYNIYTYILAQLREEKHENAEPNKSSGGSNKGNSNK